MMNYFKSGLIALITGIIVLPVSATINIAKKPLFLEGAVAPNIMFTLDNSDSMNREFSPEGIGTSDFSACNTSGKTINFPLIIQNHCSVTRLAICENFVRLRPPLHDVTVPARNGLVDTDIAPKRIPCARP